MSNQSTNHQANYDRLVAEGKTKAAEAYAKQFMGQTTTEGESVEQTKTYALKCKVSGCDWQVSITPEDKQAAADHRDRGGRCPDHYVAYQAQLNKKFTIKCNWRLQDAESKWHPCGRVVKEGTRDEVKGVVARCDEHRGLVSHTQLLNLTVAQLIEALASRTLSDDDRKALRRVINKK